MIMVCTRYLGLHGPGRSSGPGLFLEVEPEPKIFRALGFLGFSGFSGFSNKKYGVDVSYQIKFGICQ